LLLYLAVCWAVIDSRLYGKSLAGMIFKILKVLEINRTPVVVTDDGVAH
jgi:hypothetical protein